MDTYNPRTGKAVIDGIEVITWGHRSEDESLEEFEALAAKDGCEIVVIGEYEILIPSTK